MTEPAVTPAPEMTTAPEATEPAKSGGCGAIASPIALVWLFALETIIIKKRR